jgi:hypothetical protein
MFKFRRPCLGFALEHGLEHFRSMPAYRNSFNLGFDTLGRFA